MSYFNATISLIIVTDYFLDVVGGAICGLATSDVVGGATCGSATSDVVGGATCGSATTVMWWAGLPVDQRLQ